MAKKKQGTADMESMFAQQMMNMVNQFAAPASPMPPVFGGLPVQAAPGPVYYASIGGRQAGPFPAPEIARLIYAGTITRDTLIWRQGMGAWQAAVSLSEITGLFPPVSASPPPAPVPPQRQSAPPLPAPLPPVSAAPQPVSVPVPAAPGIRGKSPQQTWKNYALPLDGILNEYRNSADPEQENGAAEKEKAAILEDVLAEFKIAARVTAIRRGPVVTMFEILPAPGIKLSKIVQLEDNIALRLAASSMRIVAPIPGKEAVGIEVPNKKRSLVSFRELIEYGAGNKNDAALPVFLGKDLSGGVVNADLAAMPHLLVAGSTGSGKSVCINTLILSLVYHLSPAQCRMIFIDPKIVELKIYNGIPHLLAPVITEPEKALNALNYCLREMERRYTLLDKFTSRNIKSYNKAAMEQNAEKLPYLVVIIDEYADLMAVSGKELEAVIARLAAMSRAVGIHLILATQRPSADVITGLIKSNIPSRIAFMTASMTDSRVIIDIPGAEKLLGKGDMLYCGAESPFPVRAQGAFVSEEEAEKTAAHLKTLGNAEYIPL
jgi:S-DNA-T family DNA segregation ATPase FtsK/SpoIIIE